VISSVTNRTDNTLWTLVVRPAQEEDRNSGKPSKVSFLSVTVPAGSVVGTKDNENATKSSRRIELQTAPSFRSLWAVDASVNNNPPPSLVLKVSRITIDLMYIDSAYVSVKMALEP
jgi:hypothetical protein